MKKQEKVTKVQIVNILMGIGEKSTGGIAGGTRFTAQLFAVLIYVSASWVGKLVFSMAVY